MKTNFIKWNEEMAQRCTGVLSIRRAKKIKSSAAEKKDETVLNEYTLNEGIISDLSPDEEVKRDEILVPAEEDYLPMENINDVQDELKQEKTSTFAEDINGSNPLTSEDQDEEEFINGQYEYIKPADEDSVIDLSSPADFSPYIEMDEPVIEDNSVNPLTITEDECLPDTAAASEPPSVTNELNDEVLMPDASNEADEVIPLAPSGPDSDNTSPGTDGIINEPWSYDGEDTDKAQNIAFEASSLKPIIYNSPDPIDNTGITPGASNENSSYQNSILMEMVSLDSCNHGCQFCETENCFSKTNEGISIGQYIECKVLLP